jgi:hypothetical protein
LVAAVDVAVSGFVTAVGAVRDAVADAVFLNAMRVALAPTVLVGDATLVAIIGLVFPAGTVGNAVADRESPNTRVVRRAPHATLFGGAALFTVVGFVTAVTAVVLTVAAVRVVDAHRTGSAPLPAVALAVGFAVVGFVTAITAIFDAIADLLDTQTGLIGGAPLVFVGLAVDFARLFVAAVAAIVVAIAQSCRRVT